MMVMGTDPNLPPYGVREKSLVAPETGSLETGVEITGINMNPSITSLKNISARCRWIFCQIDLNLRFRFHLGDSELGYTDEPKS